MERCARCGACTVVCPVYKASGQECYSARGKQHLLQVYEGRQHSEAYEDIFAKCLLCGACSKACPRGLDIVSRVVDVRSGFGSVYGSHGFEKYLAREVLARPQVLHGARVAGNVAARLFSGVLPENSGLRLKLAMFDGNLENLPGDSKRTGSSGGTQPETLVHFPGCSAKYLYPAMAGGTRELFGRLGYQLNVPEGLTCCGLAFEAAGDLDAARRSARTNLDALYPTRGPIMVSCGSCWAHLKNYPHLFLDDEEYYQKAGDVVERLAEASTLLLSLVDQQKQVVQDDAKELRIFYHDPCHLRNENDVTMEPRALLRMIPGARLLELEDGPQCCGQGGLFHLGAPELSAKIRDDLSEKVLEMKPDVITTSCSGCYMQWKTALARASSRVKLLYLTEILRDRLPLYGMGEKRNG